MNNSSNQFLSDDAMIKRIIHKLGRSYGVAMLEFAIMAPIFLSATFFMYNFLSFLPKKQQVEIIARYGADGLSRGAKRDDLYRTGNDYIKKLPKICKISSFTFKSEINRKDNQLLLSKFAMTTSNMFNIGGVAGKILSIIKQVVKVVAYFASFGITGPYVDEFLQIDKTVSVTVPAIMPSTRRNLWMNYFWYRYLYKNLNYETETYCMPICDTGDIHGNYRTAFDALCGAELCSIKSKQWHEELKKK